MENLGTIQWDTFKENGTITTSTDHFIKTGEDKTLCGRRLPHETATDIYGTGYNTVSCKSCNKIKKAKLKAETATVKEIIDIEFSVEDENNTIIEIKKNGMIDHTNTIPVGKEREMIKILKEKYTVNNILSYGIVF